MLKNKEEIKKDLKEFRRFFVVNTTNNNDYSRCKNSDELIDLIYNEFGYISYEKIENNCYLINKKIYVCDAS